jgi:uncharacterized protein (TIGR03083 family)
MNEADAIDERCRLLGGAWAWWADTLGGLDDEQWYQPTRLDGWDVAALVAHHAVLVRAVRVFAGQPTDEEPATPTAAAMLRRFNEPQGVAHTLAGAVAQRARQLAMTESAEALRATFTVDAPAALTAVREAGPVVIRYVNQGPFPLAEALSIVVLEAVVHGLDLARAVDRVPDVPPAAVLFTVRLLADVADPIPFVEAATGRAGLDFFPIIR